MQDQASLLAVLNTTWFASGLDPATQTTLAGLARLFEAEPGTELFHEGDSAELFGVVVHGRVALRTHVPERGDFTILTIEPGDVFGWSSLVPPNRSTSTGVAIEALQAVVFEVPALRIALREDAPLAQAIYPRLMVAVNRRLNATRVQLLDLFAAEQVNKW
jgi:CRP/FNR family transcriptional regulator, cyclic AMP receptor protein